MENTNGQAPKTANLIKPPLRKPNKTVRTREYLTAQEVDALCKAARGLGRHGQRDEALVLLMFRHGLRVSEAISLRWEQADLKQGLLHVTRIKRGIPSTHPLRGIELRALRQLRRDSPNAPYVFVSERHTPLTARSVRHIVAKAGGKAGLGFTVHPHMLRHSTGFYLAKRP